MTKEIRPDNDDIHVALSCEMTGLEPTPPHSDDEEDAYASLGSVPTPHKQQRPAADPCGGGARG